jgi:hypothetical protein
MPPLAPADGRGLPQICARATRRWTFVAMRNARARRVALRADGGDGFVAGRDRLLGHRTNPAECFAEQACGGQLPMVIALQLGEHRSDLSLAKTEVAQRGEDLGVHIDGVGIDRLTVDRAGALPKPSSTSPRGLQ